MNLKKIRFYYYNIFWHNRFYMILAKFFLVLVKNFLVLVVIFLVLVEHKKFLENLILVLVIFFLVLVTSFLVLIIFFSGDSGKKIIKKK